MSHVFHQLYYHFAWATHSREPLVDRVWRPEFLEILNDEVKTRGGIPIRHKRDARPRAPTLPFITDDSHS